MNADYGDAPSDLDAILFAAAHELDEHLRATADATDALPSLMAEDTDAETVAPPLYPRSLAEADAAISIITARVSVRDLLSDLDLIGYLDRARDLDRALDRARDPVRDLVHSGVHDGIVDRASTLVRTLESVGARDGTVDRADALVRALGLERSIGLASIAAHKLLRALMIVNSLRLERGREVAEVLIRLQVHERSRDLRCVLETALQPEDAVGTTFDFDSALDWALKDARGLNRAIDYLLQVDTHTIDSHALNHALGHAYEIDRALNRACARDLNRGHARDLFRDLFLIEVDVSGLDLHHLKLEVDVVGGVTWTQETDWPTEIAEQVRTRSREIRPGVFQVAGPGTDHNIPDQITPAR